MKRWQRKDQIFKMQRCLMPPGGSLLIYNKSRRHQIVCHETPELVKFFGDDHKVYVEGYITKDNFLQVIRKVEPQNW